MKKKLIISGIIAAIVIVAVIVVSLLSREEASTNPLNDRKQIRKTLRIHPSQMKLNRELVSEAVREKLRQEGSLPQKEERPE